MIHVAIPVPVPIKRCPEKYEREKCNNITTATQNFVTNLAEKILKNKYLQKMFFFMVLFSNGY